MLKKKRSSKLDISSLASSLQRKPKKTGRRKVLLATIVGAGAAVAASVASKGRDPR